MQVTWWMTGSINKGIGVSLRGAIPPVRDCTIWMIFHAYCQANLNFPWKNQILIEEDAFFTRWRELIAYSQPYVIHTMGEYNVFYSGIFYNTKDIGLAIAYWLILIRYRKTNKFEGINQTWNLEAASKLLDQWQQIDVRTHVPVTNLGQEFITPKFF